MHVVGKLDNISCYEWLCVEQAEHLPKHTDTSTQHSSLSNEIVYQEHSKHHYRSPVDLCDE